jgi:hypothetical protein
MSGAASSNQRIADAVSHLERAGEELMSLLASMDREQWAAIGTAEGWPVKALAYHVADGHRIHLRWLDHMRKREPVPGTPAELDAENARTVADAGELSPDVVMSAVRTGGRLLAAYVRGLHPDELRFAVPHGPLGGEDTSIDFMLDIATWHVREHLASLRAAVGAVPRP